MQEKEAHTHLRSLTHTHTHTHTSKVPVEPRRLRSQRINGSKQSQQQLTGLKSTVEPLYLYASANWATADL